MEYPHHGFLACRPISTNLSPQPRPDLTTFALRSRIEKPANTGWHPRPPLTFLTHPRVGRRTPYPNHPRVAPVPPENNRTAGTAKNSRGTTWKIVPPQRFSKIAEDSMDMCSTLCYIVLHCLYEEDTKEAEHHWHGVSSGSHRCSPYGCTRFSTVFGVRHSCRLCGMADVAHCSTPSNPFTPAGRSRGSCVFPGRSCRRQGGSSLRGRASLRSRPSPRDPALRFTRPVKSGSTRHRFPRPHCSQSAEASRRRLVTLFHRTSADNVVSIRRDGFRDGEGQYLTDRPFAGVWFTDPSRTMAAVS